MSAAKLIAVAALCAASASAQVSDIGCFVNGVCGSGSIVGGNDRLDDEQGSGHSREYPRGQLPSSEGDLLEKVVVWIT